MLWTACTVFPRIRAHTLISTFPRISAHSQANILNTQLPPPPSRITSSTIDCVYCWYKFKHNNRNWISKLSWSIQQQWTKKLLAAASGVTWFNKNCHGGYGWEGVHLTVYVLYCLITAPFYLSLCNVMFNGNDNKKNTVFQSNMY